MTITTDLVAVSLTMHQRELVALVLREHADEMDDEVRNARGTREYSRVVLDALANGSSNRTAEMRELAHYIEWGGDGGVL